jgi:hypothetical protein
MVATLSDGRGFFVPFGRAIVFEACYSRRTQVARWPHFAGMLELDGDEIDSLSLPVRRSL